jgi:hypothetical protein
MKCSDRNQLENISSFIDFVALLIELHIWRKDIKYSSFQDASIDIKISPFEWSSELHIKCAFSFEDFAYYMYFSITHIFFSIHFTKMSRELISKLQIRDCGKSKSECTLHS